MTESVEQKVDRLLVSGRVRVLDGHHAVVEGDHGRYLVVVEGGVISCECLGFLYRATCSHSRAVGRVVVVPESPVEDA